MILPRATLKQLSLKALPFADAASASVAARRARLCRLRMMSRSACFSASALSGSRCGPIKNVIESITGRVARPSGRASSWNRSS